MLTCYDATFAKLLSAAGVDVLLVGDSLGMVLKGAENTLNVTMQDMLYHTKSVAAGAPGALIMTDMPFGSYELNATMALENAQLLIDAGATMVKLEGGGTMANTARHLIMHGIPVCAHLGFTPQSIKQLGGYKIQGKTEESAHQILQDAIAMDNAGASFVVLEMVPAQLAKIITQRISTPTIGIGAGVDCDGQVLVLQDLLGIYTGAGNQSPSHYKPPRFVHNFLEDTAINGIPSIKNAIEKYVKAVKDGTFPAIKHSY